MEESPTNGVLTQDGLEKIANHKYKSGTYTALDTFINPMWEALTQMLPLWLAPNLVTTIGGSFCVLAYCVSAYYDFAMTGDVPDWVLVLNGMCQMIYFTLDCMDGKQARRTKSSSPLGQLFDHGIDALGNLNSVSSCQCIMQNPSKQYLWMHCALQFTFFQAQWEEYYTGVLPHATGNIGVTEVMYGMALWSITTGLIFKRTIFGFVMPDFVQEANFPLRSAVVGDITEPLELRHMLAVVWIYMTTTLSILSLIRVAQHVKSPGLIASAFSKMITPTLVCAVALLYLPTDDPNSIRYASLSLGLCLCLSTIKIIVFSMGRMAFASFQLDTIPFFVVAAIGTQTPSMNSTLYAMLAAYYGIRLSTWAGSAIHHICNRLNIQLFRIKYPQLKEE